MCIGYLPIYNLVSNY